jgi:Xaa-Pro aminopeptidase
VGNDPRWPSRFRNIGVRIEDNILVTSEGSITLTADIPKNIDEIESIYI